MLSVISLCSGVGGIDLGFERAGMLVTEQVELDPKCQDVLRRHWPETDIHSDLKEFHGIKGSADVVVGGTPCQDLSRAGRRTGLGGERSSLFFDYARVIDEVEPEWIVWENVTGALTSGGGRDMGTVLGTLADLGYGVAYRVLDAQYFGVPQRRRRVVLVGRRGDVRSPAEVLALRESLPRDSAPSRTPQAVVAVTAEDGTESRVFTTTTTTTALAAADRFGADDNIAQGGKLLVTAPVAPVASSPVWADDVAPTLRAMNFDSSHLNGGGRLGITTAEPLGVRRLTPRECERLNGFPDDWTLYGASGAEIADSHRYRMMGNSVAVPVFEWVGRRIVAVATGRLAVPA